MEINWIIVVSVALFLYLLIIFRTGRLNRDPAQGHIALHIMVWAIAGRTADADALLDAQLVLVFKHYGIVKSGHQSTRLMHALSYAKAFHGLSKDDYTAARLFLRVWTVEAATHRLGSHVLQAPVSPSLLDKKSPYVFISYARPDSVIMLTIRKKLALEGINSWADNSLDVGENWDEELKNRLENAALVLVLWSQYSRASQPVRNETDYAMERSILFQAKVGTINPPESHRHIQYADLSGWTGESSDEWEALVSALRTKLNSAS